MGQTGGDAVFLTIPNKVSHSQESVRCFLSKDGTPLVEVTLPCGTSLKGKDVSFFTFVVRQTQLDPGGKRFYSTHSVILPKTNRETGEPWKVTLKKDIGHKDDDGKFIVDATKKHVCTSAELSVALRESYESYKEYRRGLAEKPGSGAAPLERLAVRAEAAKKAAAAGAGA